MINFYTHYMNILLTFRAFIRENIYDKFKQTCILLTFCKTLYICLIMLIKATFYNENFKM